MHECIRYVLYRRKYYRIIFVRSMQRNIKRKIMNLTKSERLVEALKTGEKLTAAQIKARFGIANPTATISDLRLRMGHAVYANEHKDAKGNITVKYELGRPSRKVVAAGYRALQAQA